MLKFYSEKDQWGEFSNFYPARIVVLGIEYPTSEHYFQAQKYMGPNSTDRDREYAGLIRTVNTPNKSKILARHQVRGGYSWVKPLNEMIQNYPEVQIRPDWDQVKDNIMRSGVINKFLQHNDLLQTLLSTGDQMLTEHTHRDHYWADGGDGSGKNMLGKILVETRNLLSYRIDQVRPNLYEVIYLTLYIGQPKVDDLNSINIDFLVDLTDHTLDQYIFGQKIDDPVYVYNNNIMLIQDDYTKLTIQGLGLGKKIFVYGGKDNYLHFLTQLFEGLYFLPHDACESLAQNLLSQI